MAKREKACNECRRLVRGNECPACKTTDLTKNWEGVVVVVDPDSDIAKTVGIDTPGKYAIKTR